MAVPGMMSAGFVIHLSVQAGCNRSFANRKFGAIAFLSCPASPVAWHFKQGAAVLVKSCRAISFSAFVIGGSFCGVNGCGWLGRPCNSRTDVGISARV